MNVSREDLSWAAAQGIVTPQQVEALWTALEGRSGPHAKFDAAHVLYYFGALIIIGGMSFFMSLGWESFGGGGILAIASIYALVFTLAGRVVWKRGLRIPGGLLLTVAVCMTPLGVYGLLEVTKMWPQGDPGSFRDYHVWVKGSWIVLELATIAAGLIALRSYRFSFLTMPIAFSLWYLSMDLTPLLFGAEDFSWQQRQWVSVGVGLAMLIGSYLVDRRTREDYSFWGYLFGLIAFWGALSSMDSGSELNRFLYCVVNLGLMSLSVFLDRKVFIVFGAMGVFGYLGYLAWDVFENSLIFPFALTVLGVVLIALGIWYQRHEAKLRNSIVGILPAQLLWLLPSERRAV